MMGSLKNDRMSFCFSTVALKKLMNLQFSYHLEHQLTPSKWLEERTPRLLPDALPLEPFAVTWRSEILKK